MATLFFTYLFILFYYRLNWQYSIRTLLISFGFSFIFFLFASIVAGIPYLLFYKEASNVPNIPFYTSVGIVQFVLLYTLFKSTRLLNGISSLLRYHYYYFPLFTAILFMVSISLISTYKDAYNLFAYSLRICLLLLVANSFFFYWRHRITQTYREKLRLANEKSLEDELNKQKETIANLEADNARLSQIVHKDNKIILAMLTAVTEHLENATNSAPDEQIIRAKELRVQLQNMADERQGILNAQSNLSNVLPKSGLHTVDGMLSFMETRAKGAGIIYKLQLEENIKELAGKSINEADLLHMLGDLIDNAIIAVKHTNNKKGILIHLGSLQEHFLLEISDSGIPFSFETYQHFGNEQHTTHGENGGSGIGLMDIWKLKKKYKASLHIYEYEDVEGIYTKKLAFIFDRKNHFLLQTPRYKEATYALSRGDLYIFSNKEE